MSITKFQAVWLSTHLILRARRTFNKGYQQLYYITMIFILSSLVFFGVFFVLNGFFLWDADIGTPEGEYTLNSKGKKDIQ